MAETQRQKVELPQVWYDYCMGTHSSEQTAERHGEIPDAPGTVHLSEGDRLHISVFAQFLKEVPKPPIPRDDEDV